MRYRKLDANGDYSFGNSLADFYIDVPLAAVQAVVTRLRLYLGEWFVDTTDGTAWNTKVLGMRTIATRDPEIKRRVLGTPHVMALLAYQSQADGPTRRFSVEMTVLTDLSPTPVGLSLALAPPEIRYVTDDYGNFITDDFGNKIRIS